MACDYLALAMPGVAALSPYQPGKPTEELERELGISNIVKLASNENPLGPSPMAVSAMERVMTQTCRYPDGNGFALKAALSEKFDLNPAMLTLGNGSNDVLDIIARAFAGPGVDVVYSQYAFAVYALSTMAVNAKAVVVPAKEWGHDLEAMLAAISDSTRLVFIANPNNPTGTMLSEAEIRRFLERVPENVIVVLDEAYIEYQQESDAPDGLRLLPDFGNLIVTRTFSKAWGLASLRVGYAVSNPQLADILNRVRQPFNVNSMALAAATAVLDDDAYLQRSVQVNNDGMAQLQEGFKVQGLDYIPSRGNFICVDCGRPAGEVYQALLREGVIVRPIANYGMPNHLRVSIGLQEENARFIEALAKVL